MIHVTDEELNLARPDGSVPRTVRGQPEELNPEFFTTLVWILIIGFGLGFIVKEIRHHEPEPEPHKVIRKNIPNDKPNETEVPDRFFPYGWNHCGLSAPVNVYHGDALVRVIHPGEHGFFGVNDGQWQMFVEWSGSYYGWVTAKNLSCDYRGPIQVVSKNQKAYQLITSFR